MGKLTNSLVATLAIVSISSTALASDSAKAVGNIGDYKIEGYSSITNDSNSVSVRTETVSYTQKWSGKKLIWTTTPIDKIKANAILYDKKGNIVDSDMPSSLSDEYEAYAEAEGKYDSSKAPYEGRSIWYAKTGSTVWSDSADVSL
ncbi:hypothetical protein BLGI_4761 [Brevibacillus laterosporus GI-9]|uniref:hypothetical protein n=1 Tax=Brevibacillus laterosporus TaxID=1465 RepID=UPI0002405484|nr:hypothetical protein [Brevibacillus laterosporus]CCF16792.1 hypothetical protein BLGI_4761 [Brevibacillus laterosporus GI-9]